MERVATVDTELAFVLAMHGMALQTAAPAKRVTTAQGPAASVCALDQKQSKQTHAPIKERVLTLVFASALAHGEGQSATLCAQPHQRIHLSSVQDMASATPTDCAFATRMKSTAFGMVLPAKFVILTTEQQAVEPSAPRTTQMYRRVAQLMVTAYAITSPQLAIAARQSAGNRAKWIRSMVSARSATIPFQGTTCNITGLIVTKFASVRTAFAMTALVEMELVRAHPAGLVSIATLHALAASSRRAPTTVPVCKQRLGVCATRHMPVQRALLCAPERAPASAMALELVLMALQEMAHANVLMGGCGHKQHAQLCVNATVMEPATSPTQLVYAIKTSKDLTANGA